MPASPRTSTRSQRAGSTALGRRLDLRGSGLTADAGADLRHALPDCTVLLAGDRWVHAAFAAPTWAREPRGD